VRHRTIRAKGCLSNKTALAMVFKLVDAAQKSWRRLDGHNQLPKLIQGVTFTDGIEVAVNPASSRSQTAADEIGVVVEVEPHPPQTGPTYRMDVQFAHARVPGVFRFEYELVKAAPRAQASLVYEGRVKLS
jgi:hypothetical protein